MPFLVISSVVAMLWSLALSAVFLRAWATSVEGSAGVIGASLSAIGLLGIISGIAIIWSDRHEGRGSWIGILFAVLYLGITFVPPLILVTLHLYGLPALMLLALSLWNAVKWGHSARS